MGDRRYFFNETKFSADFGGPVMKFDIKPRRVPDSLLALLLTYVSVYALLSSQTNSQQFSENLQIFRMPAGKSAITRYAQRGETKLWFQGFYMIVVETPE